MIRNKIKEAIQVKENILKDQELLERIALSVELLTNSFKTGSRVFFCGNGGSAADAQHLAAEFSGKFYFDRPPLPAEACHGNSSFVTAVSNDYSYEKVFSRYIEAMGRTDDVLIGISTSGNSDNIIHALRQAKKTGMSTIGMTGQSGGKIKELADILLNVPSADTPRIQEAHILIGHIICEQVEKNLFA